MLRGLLVGWLCRGILGNMYELETFYWVSIGRKWLKYHPIMLKLNFHFSDPRKPGFWGKIMKNDIFGYFSEMIKVRTMIFGRDIPLYM